MHASGLARGEVLPTGDHGPNGWLNRAITELHQNNTNEEENRHLGALGYSAPIRAEEQNQEMRDGEENTQNKTDLKSCGRTKSNRRGTTQHSQDPKTNFSLRTNKSTTDLWRSPPSLPH
jgi:hypothetical protein